jgi:dipeptidyl aminopeptidase/acylaminoacyl peptidase
MRPLALLIPVAWSVAALADNMQRPTDGEQAWHLRLSTVDKTYIVRPDGTDQREVEYVAPAHGQLSPDGKRRLVIDLENGIWVATLADADGKNAKRLTESSASQICASWSPDGKRIAYASGESGKPQIYTADADGSNVKQITHEALGAWPCKYGPGGQLAYVVWRGPPKLRPSDLIVADGKRTSAIVRNTWIGEFEWSPDGKTIAYSKYRSLVFHELESGKEREIVFKDIDPRLTSHTVWKLAWRGDNQAVACQIAFLGGRVEGTHIFGDDEVFVLPREGKPTWFKPAEKIERVEWVTGER